MNWPTSPSRRMMRPSGWGCSERHETRVAPWHVLSTALPPPPGRRGAWSTSTVATTHCAATSSWMSLTLEDFTAPRVPRQLSSSCNRVGQVHVIEPGPSACPLGSNRIALVDVAARPGPPAARECDRQHDRGLHGAGRVDRLHAGPRVGATTVMATNESRHQSQPPPAISMPMRSVNNHFLRMIR